MVSASNAAVVAVVAITLGVVGAAAFGVGPFSADVVPNGGTATDSPSADDPGTGGESAGGDGASGSSGTATPEPAPFGFQIDSIEECGTTCRDVTATLTNQRESPATDVTATTRIYVENDQIWQGSEDIGRLDAGESTTTTKRVEIGYFDAAKIQNNGGYVTVETTITTVEGSYTFSGRRQVA
ncbi:hypothetical protein [Salinirubrum litoreum]|uniref:Uncharacterized protein n=1 Tax=Salinirubrum litoreum TaxID=1126234 RepID=A0ABD5RDW5_9EURY|nr:hypothetical protein [Salinirubrum litoreum]